MMGNIQRSLAWAGLGALAGFLLLAFQPAAHALPEYATRTGEPCATCHVNPAGGGARTERGNLWIAAGRPDTVPPLPAGSASDAPTRAAAASGTAADGAGFYTKFGCSGCHGATGTGGAGPALTQNKVPADRLSQIVRQGQGTMPGLPSTVSDAELAALVQYVQALSAGETKAPSTGPARLGPPRVACTNQALSGCRGN